MLEWTGERFLPWIKESTIAYEHLHRYAYTSAFVKGKIVLDLACGEGYGSKMMSQQAASVVGIDIDEIAVRHATHKYAGENLQFLSASITAIPLTTDRPFDVIVCFEAIEHIEDQEKLLNEVNRLLKPDGIFIVSTPNKAVYRHESSEENPFHVKELYFEEFHQLLAHHFHNTGFLGQRIHPSSSIWPIGGSSAKGFHEFVIERGSADFEFIKADKRVPLYFIAIASNTADVPALEGSVLIDQSDSLIEEKNQQAQWFEQQAGEHGRKITSLEEAVRWQESQVQELSEGLEWTRTHAKELEETIASQEEALAWRASQLGDLETARAYWERENASLAASLEGTRRQLSVTTGELSETADKLRITTASLSVTAGELGVASGKLSAASKTLDDIYASRGWRFIVKLRQIRDSLTGRGKSRG